MCLAFSYIIYYYFSPHRCYDRCCSFSFLGLHTSIFTWFNHLRSKQSPIMAPPATTLAANLPTGEPRVYTMTAPPKPALTPPPGVIPDFDDPYSLLPYVNLTIAGGIFITTVLTAARLYVKARIVKKFLWEDWTGFAGYVSNHILCYTILANRPGLLYTCIGSRLLIAKDL